MAGITLTSKESKYNFWNFLIKGIKQSHEGLYKSILPQDAVFPCFHTTLLDFQGSSDLDCHICILDEVSLFFYQAKAKAVSSNASAPPAIIMTRHPPPVTIFPIFRWRPLFVSGIPVEREMFDFILVIPSARFQEKPPFPMIYLPFIILGLKESFHTKSSKVTTCHEHISC